MRARAGRQCYQTQRGLIVTALPRQTKQKTMSRLNQMQTIIVKVQPAVRNKCYRDVMLILSRTSQKLNQTPGKASTRSTLGSARRRGSRRRW